MNLQNHPGVLRIFILAVLRVSVLFILPLDIPSRRGSFDKSLHIRLASLWSHCLRVRDTTPRISLGIFFTSCLASPSTLFTILSSTGHGIPLSMPALPSNNVVNGWKRALCTEPLKVVCWLCIVTSVFEHFVHRFTFLLSLGTSPIWLLGGVLVVCFLVVFPVVFFLVEECNDLSSQS
jgi:hypothetical protein